MAWKGWTASMPVQVCGVRVEIAEGDNPAAANVIFDKNSTEVFSNLSSAKAILPDLDPEVNGKRFSWAMRGEVDKENGPGRETAIRFETWEAERMYSA